MSGRLRGDGVSIGIGFFTPLLFHGSRRLLEARPDRA